VEQENSQFHRSDFFLRIPDCPLTIHNSPLTTHHSQPTFLTSTNEYIQ